MGGVSKKEREKDKNNFWELCDIIKHIHKESQSTLIKHDQAPHRSLINYCKRLGDILPQRQNAPRQNAPRTFCPKTFAPL